MKVPVPQISFDADIKPLFREKDRDSMLRAFDLWSYADVQAHADAIALAAGVALGRDLPLCHWNRLNRGS